MFLNAVGLVLGAAQVVHCWKFATADEFRSASTRNQDTLVACEYIIPDLAPNMSSDLPQSLR